MNILLIFLASGYFFTSAHANEDRRAFEIEREQKQILLWTAKLDESTDWSNDVKLDRLSTGLRNMAHRKSHPGHSKDVDSLYLGIQSLLLSIPGHASYFATEIRREQKDAEGLPTNYGERVGYDFRRSMHFRTLAHLPSPETIQILGQFLHDEKDAPVPEVSPNSDWGRNPRANCWGAVATIADIGLRAPPVTRHSGWDDDGSALAKCRSWWAEIESGSRTFSFRGQNVEYRFKPDGTWETMAMANPPNDGEPPVRQPGNIEASPKPRQQSESPEPPRGINPWWLASMGILLFAALGLWLRTRGRRPA